MAYAIGFSALAAADLDAIDSYIARDSPQRAFEFVQRIRRRCELLSEFPQQGTRRDDLAPGLRTLGFERRVTIAFRIEGRVVRILRVLYAGQDLPRHWG